MQRDHWIDAQGAAEGMPSGARPAVELSIVVPTFKERDNVRELVRRLERCLAGTSWEVVFVDDDSPDQTAEEVRQLARHDPRVRCLQRIGRRGLSSACIEGVLASSAEIVAVMDADLQHDETLLPQMLAALKGQPLDIVVGSRYVEGGGLGAWNETRALVSRLATRVSYLVVPPDLKDPMSGFFMVRREAFMRCVHRLSAVGFKILVDLFASSPQPLRFRELPYTFRNRVAGESKLDERVAWEYLLLLLDKRIGHLVPVRFLSFAAIGLLGVVVHMTVLALTFGQSAAGFVQAQALATGTAMVFNYSINNAFTYRDRRLTGTRWWGGLASFTLACSVGAVANVGIANYLFRRDGGAWLLAAFAGILVGAVWNYATTSVYTWGRKTA
jgi:dolichol-phosphate mannosyltransferase